MRALALVAFTVLAAAAPVPPAPTRWVEDHAAFLSTTTRTTLDARLESYERATGHQVVVWIGKTIENAPLDDWAVRTFRDWKIGRKGHDDGIAMFVLADDRKIDIEVGYGLEDKVPDAVASRIIREVMTPRLRAGDRDGAITAGVDAVLAAIEGKPWTAEAAPPPEDKTSWIIGAIVVVAFVIFAITHPRMAMLLLWTIVASRRNGRGGGGLGGSGLIGGLGGFGGGGGRSGGGGARGGW